MLSFGVCCEVTVTFDLRLPDCNQFTLESKWYVKEMLRYHFHKNDTECDGVLESFEHGTIRFLFSFIISRWYGPLYIASCSMFPVLLLIFYLLHVIFLFVVSPYLATTPSLRKSDWLVYSQINQSLSMLIVLWTSPIKLFWQRWWIKAFFLFCSQ